MESFENKLRNLLFDAREYGTVITGIEFPNGSLALQEYRQKLVVNCHLGFRKAQNFILGEILEIQNEVSQLKNNLKTSRVNRDQSKSYDFQARIKLKTFEEKVYRKIADAIAWQLFYAQSYFARRLYSGRTPAVNLSKSNIESALETVNNIHKTYAGSIALLSDITSFIGIGDILFKEPEKISVIELKQGKMNEIIWDFVNEEKRDDVTIKDLVERIKNDYGDKAGQQAQRMINQGIKMKRLSDVINTGFGIDNCTGQPIIIPEDPVEIELFSPKLIWMVNNLYFGNKDWRYEVIESCIHIGVYKNKFTQIGEQLIHNLILERTGKDYPVLNYIASCLNSPLAEPFFIKPFTKEQLITMILGKIKIFIGIDFDELIIIFQRNGLEATWISRKETTRANYNNELFIFENQAIQCSLNNASVFLGKGYISRLIFSHVLPSSIAQSIVKTLKPQSEIYGNLGFTSRQKDFEPTLISRIDLNIDPYL